MMCIPRICPGGARAKESFPIPRNTQKGKINGFEAWYPHSRELKRHIKKGKHGVTSSAPMFATAQSADVPALAFSTAAYELQEI